MTQSASFRVDPRLTAILGASYSSSERALRELIDNAWDAEATEVHVTLPDILSDAPIIVTDNGSGMKGKELRTDYLNIANPRLSRKGERTPNLLRVVKGRRGIGKFAGLILAETMEIETKARGQFRSPNSEVRSKSEIRNRKSKMHGNFPKVDKLREILAGDYGRETDFVIFLNGERVFRHDIQGKTFTREIPLPNGQTAVATYTIAEKPVEPRNTRTTRKELRRKRLGDQPYPPAKAQCRPALSCISYVSWLPHVVGEINLPPDNLELTAAGGDVIESDKSFEHLANVIQQNVNQSLEETHTNEVNLAKARWVQMMNRRLENVPEHRRAIAEERLNKLISRSYQEGEKEERITVLVSLVLDALELDEYWTVCREV